MSAWLRSCSIREVLVGLTLLTIAGTAAELALIGHWQDTLQLLSWAAVILLLIALLCALVADDGRLRWAARWAALPAVPVSLWGVYEHFEANYLIAEELNPDSGTLHVAWEAARGRLPLLAPFTLVVPAITILLITVIRQRQPILPLQRSGPAHFALPGAGPLLGSGGLGSGSAEGGEIDLAGGHAGVEAAVDV